MKMKLSHCKLKRNVQIKLLEFFALEVTARSAADLLENLRQFFRSQTISGRYRLDLLL